MRRLVEILLILGVLFCGAAAEAAERRRSVRVETPAAPSADCPSTGPSVCTESGTQSFAALNATEVEALVRAAAAAVDEPSMTIAVTDRAGRVLAVYRNPAADPANDDEAVGLARTAAMFSHDQAPLSSRTVRFISGVHFPPGVKRAPAAALYGIENTNRGCDLAIEFNAGKCLPAPRSVNGRPCDPFDPSGCGTGIVTGKPDAHDGHADGHPSALGLRGPANPGGLAVNPGGIPIFRTGSFAIRSGSLEAGDAKIEVGGPSHLLGGIGVAGTSTPEAAEFAAFAGAAFAGGGLFPAPEFPLPFPGRVVIDGIRLPFVEQGLRPTGTSAGSPDAGTFALGPTGGGCAPNRYLAGPVGGSDLSSDEVDAIVRGAVAAAQTTRAAIRLPLDRSTRMAIAVAGLDGKILALYRMPDATVFSIDVAVAKARNVIWLSSAEGSRDLEGVSPERSITNRTLSFGAQPLFPSGIDGTEPGPFFDLFLRDLANPCSQGSQPAHAAQNGLVFFPGSLPLYRDGRLVGGLGVSGDGVEQDDWVSWSAAPSFRPPREIWPDRVMVRGVRLPFLKFPRQPEGVVETPVDGFDEP